MEVAVNVSTVPAFCHSESGSVGRGVLGDLFLRWEGEQIPRSMVRNKAGGFGTERAGRRDPLSALPSHAGLGVGLPAASRRVFFLLLPNRMASLGLNLKAPEGG